MRQEGFGDQLNASTHMQCLLLMAGQAERTCCIGLAQERPSGGIVYVVAGAALDRPGVEFYFIGRGAAPALLGIGRCFERRILDRRWVGHGDRVVIAQIYTEYQLALSAVKVRVAAFAVWLRCHIRGREAWRFYQIVFRAHAVAVHDGAGIDAIVTAQAQARSYQRLPNGDVHRGAAIEREDLRRLGAVPERCSGNSCVGVGPVRGVTELAHLRCAWCAQIMPGTYDGTTV